MEKVRLAMAKIETDALMKNPMQAVVKDTRNNVK